jgi:hypothetical protein
MGFYWFGTRHPSSKPLDFLKLDGRVFVRRWRPVWVQVGVQTHGPVDLGRDPPLNFDVGVQQEVVREPSHVGRRWKLCADSWYLFTSLSVSGRVPDHPNPRFALGRLRSPLSEDLYPNLLCPSSSLVDNSGSTFHESTQDPASLIQCSMSSMANRLSQRLAA